MIEFIVAHKAVLLGAALAVSEVLALIPGLAANGIFDAIFKALKKFSGQA